MNELRDVAKIQVGSDMIPNVMSNQVVPVIDVNPKHARLGEVLTFKNHAVSGSSSFYTTNTLKDTRVTGVMFHLIKDVACDVATGAANITCVINGASQALASISLLTATAQSDVVFLSFPQPLKVDRGSIIGIGSNTYAAGLMSRSVVIYGYVIDNSNA